MNNAAQSIEQHKTLLAELLGFLLVTSLQKKEQRRLNFIKIYSRTLKKTNIVVRQLSALLTTQERSTKPYQLNTRKNPAKAVSFL
ncbi:hypothetical protein [Synechococcus sp. MIT S1220]|uniref:hypothetical protein n=1 Tax=Synechococcus sp. MIT S1220 TaxID=3082549 RepID=UPI0039B0869D